MALYHLTKDDFDKTVAEGIVLVDFWATWCGPCRMLAPVIEDLSVKYEGKAKVCKVDVDDQPELAQRFGIMSIPTVIVFKNGVEAGKLIGVSPASAYENLLD